MLVMHVRLAAGGVADVPVPAAWNALAYVVSGPRSIVGCGLARAPDGRICTTVRRVIELAAIADTDLLVLAGEPIDEPVVSWGPFVMNTTEEIIQARKDYASGRMGALAGR